MTMYKAIVTDKINRRRVVIESEHNTKSEFIHDLRANGYAVNPVKVKTKEVFDYIINYTNCYPWDWKDIKSVPAEQSYRLSGGVASGEKKGRYVTYD